MGDVKRYECFAHEGMNEDAAGSYVRLDDYQSEKARADAADADARRYRWLREQNWNESELCVVAYPAVAVRLGHDCPSLDRLDAFVDAAIGATHD